ncbi:MAG: amino acid adenylation domain-containing protein, partial [Gemmatimonadetes bacterium]|nr:amino acid adenylation domain-containing protein [Gemmatimonadota bacterium]
LADAGGQAPFQAVFNFNHFHVYDALAAAGVRLEGDRSIQQTEVPLLTNALISPATGALRIRLDCDPARLSPAQAHALAGWYRRALASLAASPDRRWDADELLDEEEVALLLRWGAGPEAEPARCGVHHLFERQAALTPDAVALVHEGTSLTYRELNERANRLAHALRRRGVGPESRVGLHLARGPELPAAMLAVLKAGGAYVPLDPAYPAERLAFVLADAGVAVLLTQEAVRGGLPAAPGTEVLVIDRQRDEIAAEPAGDPAGGALPENTAWVIYTSGSTGRPKGVAIEHRSAVVFLHWLRGQVPDEERRAVLGSTSISFDVSVAEIFGTLCWGGTLHLVENALSLAALPPDAGILRASMVPSAAAELLRLGRIPPSLRSLGLGGEAVPPSLARQLHALGTLERVENLYGPTEDTTYSTCWVIPPGTEGMRVGRTVAGTQAYVLDGGLALAPRGARGELYLAGAGLARGYLDRPALTAERFLPCPWGPPGSRMYRVGDQVRWTADGELEYLDRLDHQVKIRGFRVEPGEVEEALRARADVGDAAVVARPREEGGAWLVAYVTGARGGDAAGAPRVVDEPALAESLRAHLAARLPAYMVPGAVVVLNALPRTPNGKTDRRALPEPVRNAAASYAPPHTAVEAALAEAWSEVLGVERVGMDDNYFALGGDSIRSVRLVAAVQRRGLSISVPHLYRARTVRELAASLEPSPGDAGTTQPSREPFALLAPDARDRLPDDVEDAYPASRVQLAMLYHTQRDPASLIYHEILNYRVQTALDEKAMREALRRVAARHPLLRTSFDLGAHPEPIQRVHREAEIPLEVVDLRHLDPAAQDAWVDREKARGFDWTRPPLLRFHVHRIADDTFRLILVEHHAVLDGWSVASLMTELLRLYVALRDGGVDSTGAPPVTGFRDFVALEREAIASAESRDFWRRVVDDVPVAALPPREGDDAPRLDAAPFLWVDPSPETAAGLRRVAERAGVPLKTVLLAAHLRVLALLGGGGEVVTGYVTSGRPETGDGERVLGVFLN